MATSGVFGFTVNRDQIVRMALVNIGKLDEIEGPTPQQTTDMVMWLNMLTKQWMGKTDFAPGLKVFTRRHGHLMLSSLTGQYILGNNVVGWTNNLVQTMTTLTVSSGTSVSVVSSNGMLIGDNFGIDMDSGYVFWTKVANIAGNVITTTTPIPSIASSGASVYDYKTTAQAPLTIETATLRDSTGNDVPLKMMNYEEYDILPSKVAQNYISDPSAIYYEQQLNNGILYTDVAGSADGSKHICLTWLEPTQDFVNPLDNPEYTQEWYLPLALGLSKLAAPMIDCPWTPLHESNYQTALSIAQQKDPQRTTLYFQCKED